MGIGGLDEQFIQILRRAFASRVFPPEVTEQLGVKHVKGLLLYGPPGINYYKEFKPCNILDYFLKYNIIGGRNFLKIFIFQVQARP